MLGARAPLGRPAPKLRPERAVEVARPGVAHLPGHLAHRKARCAQQHRRALHALPGHELGESHAAALVDELGEVGGAVGVAPRQVREARALRARGDVLQDHGEHLVGPLGALLGDDGGDQGRDGDAERLDHLLPAVAPLRVRHRRGGKEVGHELAVGVGRADAAHGVALRDGGGEHAKERRPLVRDGHEALHEPLGPKVEGENHPSAVLHLFALPGDLGERHARRDDVEVSGVGRQPVQLVLRPREHEDVAPRPRLAPARLVHDLPQGRGHASAFHEPPLHTSSIRVAPLLRVLIVSWYFSANGR